MPESSLASTCPEGSFFRYYLAPLKRNVSYYCQRFKVLVVLLVAIAVIVVIVVLLVDTFFQFLND
jgi:type III secretory pathway component EscT